MGKVVEEIVRREMRGIAGIGGDDRDARAAHERIDLVAEVGVKKGELVDEDEAAPIPQIFHHRARAHLVSAIIFKRIVLGLKTIVSQEATLATAWPLICVDPVDCLVEEGAARQPAGPNGFQSSARSP